MVEACWWTFKLEKFWKNVTSFKKINSNFIQLRVDGKHLIKPCYVNDDFSMHFQPVYITLLLLLFIELQMSFYPVAVVLQ
jgi:hypothetical protein